MGRQEQELDAGSGDGLFGKGECSCVEKDRVPTVGTRSVVELGLWGSRGTCGRKWVRTGSCQGASGLETLRGLTYRANERPRFLAVQVRGKPGVPVAVVHNGSFAQIPQRHTNRFPFRNEYRSILLLVLMLRSVSVAVYYLTRRQ